MLCSQKAIFVYCQLDNLIIIVKYTNKGLDQSVKKLQTSQRIKPSFHFFNLQGFLALEPIHPLQCSADCVVDRYK